MSRGDNMMQMRQSTLIILATGLTLLMSCGCTATSTKAPPAESEAEHSARLEKFFDSMRLGRPSQTTSVSGPRIDDPPELTWKDVPALLKRAGSRTSLADFPSNPASGYMQNRCSEGMMALWLIEGIRLGKNNGIGASRNPLCLGADEAGNWEEVSSDNHQQVAQAYRTWWDKVKDMPEEKRAGMDPLEGTGLHWY